MIRIADLDEIATDGSRSHYKTWFAALLAAFAGGLFATATVMVLLWLSTPCVG